MITAVAQELNNRDIITKKYLVNIKNNWLLSLLVYLHADCRAHLPIKKSEIQDKKRIQEKSHDKK